MFSEILQKFQESTRFWVRLEDSCRFTVRNYTTQKDLGIGVGRLVKSGDPKLGVKSIVIYIKILGRLTRSQEREILYCREINYCYSGR